MLVIFTVEVAVAFAVVMGVVVTVVEAGVSRQVHTAATKDAACVLKLLNCDDLESVARAASLSRLLLLLAVTVTVCVSVSVS